MAITVVINGVVQTVAAGATVAVRPSDRIRIEVGGQVIDPATVLRDVSAADVTLTLPDGQVVTLSGFVDVAGGAGGGLRDADGTVAIASTLESLSAPAAGGEGGGPDSGPDSAGNLSIFNAAVIDALGLDFGAGAGPDGGGDAPGDLAAILAALGDGIDPNQILSTLIAVGVISPLAVSGVGATVPAGTTPAGTTPAGTTPAPATATSVTVTPTTATLPDVALIPQLFTPGDDVVDLNDVDDILARTGIPDLATLQTLVGLGFNISAALPGDDAVALPEPGSPLFGLFPAGSFMAGAGDDTVFGGAGADTLFGDADGAADGGVVDEAPAEVPVALAGTPGDLPGTAQSLDGLGTNLLVAGAGSGQFDFYAFTVAGNGADVVLETTAGNFDSELFLYDAAGNLVEDDDDGGVGRLSKIAQFLAAGSYFVVVGKFSSRDDGIDGNFTPTGDVPEAGDTYSLSVIVDPIPVAGVPDGDDRLHGGAGDDLIYGDDGDDPMAVILDGGRLAYATSVSDSDVADGWRDRRADGGRVIDCRSDETVVEGLSMPHSPRIHRGRLWALDSGTGRFGAVDRKAGRFEEIAFLPGLSARARLRRQLRGDRPLQAARQQDLRGPGAGRIP